MKQRPELTERPPLCEGRYKCGCTRFARLEELPQLCPVHRQVQTELSVLSQADEGNQ